MSAAISSLVDRGLLLRAQIQEAEDELSVIEKKLKTEALRGEQVELADAEREGRQWIALGTEAAVPVVITSDLISQTFADGSPAHARLEAIAGERLGQFYRPCTTWKMLAPSGKAFRNEAFSILGNAGAEFVSAATAKDKNGIPKNQIKVEWDRAEDVK